MLRWASHFVPRQALPTPIPGAGTARRVSTVLLAIALGWTSEAPALIPTQVAADAAVSEARAAQARGDITAARTAATRALALIPNHPEALSLLSTAMTPSPSAVAPGDVSAAELTTACDDARFLFLAGQERAAVDRLTTAIAAHAANAPADLRQRAQAQLAAARSGEDSSEHRAALIARNQAVVDANEGAANREHAIVSIRNERLARIRDLQHRDHVELALASCRTLLHDMPGDEEVDALFRELLESAHQRRQSSTADRERVLRTEVALQVERSLIPEGFDGRPVYPVDWSQRRAGRVNTLEVAEQPPVWLDRINDRLAQRLSVSFDAQPVPDAIAQIARLSGINIVTAPDILAAVDRLVTLQARQMRLADILAWVVQQASTKWSVSDGVVYIGEQAEKDRSLVIHDIADLVLGTPNFPGPAVNYGGSTGGGAAPPPVAAAAGDAAGTPTADDIADLIKRSVSPATWALEGVGIQVRGANLVVMAPDRVQRLIREFLRMQSLQRSLAVRVESRWLTLNDSMIEEIGVQWNSNTTNPITTGLTPSNGFLRSMNGWQFNGGLSTNLPAVTVTGAGVPGTGLSLQGAMVNGTKLSAILTAVERTSDGRILESPDICCLNGQRAHVQFLTQLAYISGYAVVGGNYDPTISVLNLGYVLDVQPIVSADRKYVTMDLRATTSSATLFVEYIRTWTVQGAGINGAIATAVYPIELPNVSLRAAETTVRLPDRGSLLVGGFGATIDQFAASRIPLLGSIPFLGRLFGSRGRYSEHSKMFLLTTVSIINYPELEARL